MSRIGKQIINIPVKTEVSFSGETLTVKGPLGEIKRKIGNDIEIKIADGKVTLSPKTSAENDNTDALWGASASHIVNMIEGVNKPYEKRLIVEGIGYKADVKGKEIILSVGFSHQVKIAIPEGLKVVSDKNGIGISGIDKELVGQFSAQIRSTKVPEPYKGKGIRYDKEVIRRKEGKKAA